MKTRYNLSLLAVCAAIGFTPGRPGRGDQPVHWSATENAEWRPLDAPSTSIVPGSALDMSRLIETPAGRHGRVVLGKTGRFVFEKKPEQRAVFFGCSIAPHEILGKSCTTKPAIRAWAESVRRQGYNMVRPHFLDHYLTGASKTDLEFDPEALDRFDYMVACLKDNGIYLYLDAMTSWRGYKAVPGWSPQAKEARFKSRIFFDEAVREHWKTGVGQLLQHENPYTKTRLVDDPVVAVVLYFNEQNLNFYRGIDEGFTAPWRAWLKKKYGTTEAFRAAWINAAGKCLLADDVTLDTVPLFTPNHLWQSDPRARDVGLFVDDLHAELLDWFNKTIRELGYTGLVTHYDWLNHLGIQALRNRVPVISMHGYHAHPSDFVTKGSKISQESAVAAANRLFNSMATTRYGNRPFARHRIRPGLLEPLSLRGRTAHRCLRGVSGLGRFDGPRLAGRAAHRQCHPSVLGGPRSRGPRLAGGGGLCLSAPRRHAIAALCRDSAPKRPHLRRRPARPGLECRSGETVAADRRRPRLCR